MRVGTQRVDVCENDADFFAAAPGPTELAKFEEHGNEQREAKCQKHTGFDLSVRNVRWSLRFRHAQRSPWLAPAVCATSAPADSAGFSIALLVKMAVFASTGP